MIGRIVRSGLLKRKRQALGGKSLRTPGSRLAAVAAVLLLPALFGCAQPPTQWRGVVKIGLVAPFSGYDTGSAATMLQAARATIQEAHRGGGIGGYRLELVVLDDGNDAELAVARARELAVDGAVVATVARLGGNGGQVVAHYQALHVPLVTIGSPLDSSAAGKGIRHMCVDAGEEGRQAARFAAEEAGAKRAAVIALGGDGYVAAARAFGQAAAARGLPVSSPVDDPGRRALTTAESLEIARAVTATTTDFVYYSGPYESGVELARALTGATRTTLLLGSDANTASLPPLLPPDSVPTAVIAACAATPAERRAHPGEANQSPAGTAGAPTGVLAGKAAQYIIAVAWEAAASGRPSRVGMAAAMVARLGVEDGLDPVAFDAGGRRLAAAATIYRLSDDRPGRGESSMRR